MPPVTKRLADPDTEAVRRNHETRLGDVEGAPALGLTVLGDFLVPTTGSVLISHRLGRSPRQVIMSPPIVPGSTSVTGGIIVELIGPDLDRTQTIRLVGVALAGPVTVSVSVL